METTNTNSEFFGAIVSIWDDDRNQWIDRTILRNDDNMTFPDRGTVEYYIDQLRKNNDIRWVKYISRKVITVQTELETVIFA